MLVVIIEHVTKDEDGNIKRGDSCFIPCGDNPVDRNNVISMLESEIEVMVDEYPGDTMLLIATKEMTEKEMEEAGEFEGW